MRPLTKKFLLIAMPTFILLAACSPAQAATPNLEEIESQVGTSVALTVTSQRLETVEAQPPTTETPLPLPTATQVHLDTPTAVPPLNTPTALPLPTTIPGSNTDGSSNVQQEYSCEAINRRPYDNTVFKPGDKFDIKWTIINTGTKTMRAGLDLKFSNGDKLMPDRIVELPEIKPGAEYVIDFDAVAPKKEDTYVMVYMVEGGLCYPYTAIIVEK